MKTKILEQMQWKNLKTDDIIEIVEQIDHVSEYTKLDDRVTLPDKNVEI